MKSYRFPLEQVLDIRKNIERQRQNEFAQAQRIVDENIQTLGQIHNHQQESQGAYSQQQQTMVNANSCLQYYSYFCTLERQMTQQAERVHALETEAEQKRSRLETASRDKLAIEELKKTDLKRFQRQALKQEQKDIDEISTITYNYKRRLACLK